jgi:hypothetical protein
MVIVSFGICLRDEIMQPMPSDFTDNSCYYRSEVEVAYNC